MDGTHSEVVKWPQRWAHTWLLRAGLPGMVSALLLGALLAILAAAFDLSETWKTLLTLGIAVAIVYFGGVLGNLLMEVSPLFRFRLDVFCPFCQSHLPSDMSWVCAHCHVTNDPRVTPVASYLNRCGHCSASPKALLCPAPSCARLIFLDQGRVGTHPATVPASPIPSATDAVRRAERAAELDALTHKVLLTTRQKELLQAEHGRLVEEGKLAARERANAPKPQVDSVAAVKQGLREHFSFRVRASKTRTDVRRIAQEEIANVQRDPDFLSMPPAEQEALLADLHAYIDQSEQKMRDM